MKKDYRKDLEKAARQMILVRRMEVLIRLILRIIMRNVRVNHIGILIYDQDRDEYIVKVSKGEKGIKIPEGFTKVSKNNSIIRYFTEKNFKMFNQDFLLFEKINYYVSYSKHKEEKSTQSFLKELKEQLLLYQARVCLPCFFRHNLIGVIFLGSKQDKTNFKLEEMGFLSVLASDVAMAIQNTWLFERLQKQLDANKKLFLSTVTTLASAIEAKDRYTLGHTERVVNLALNIATNLKDSQIEDWIAFKENLSISALLHDIGKISIPESILNKAGPLTDEERQFIIRHPIVGNEILNPIKEFKEVLKGVKYHHERPDGKGYPFSLKGNEIPLIASIISLADSYDAMTSDRPYRRALTEKEAIKEIKINCGKQFEPCVVEAFLRYISKKNSNQR